MFEGECFGILEYLHRSKLPYGKIRADHTYKGINEPIEPYDQNPNYGAEGGKN
jgi:hypothetical protein